MVTNSFVTMIMSNIEMKYYCRVPRQERQAIGEISRGIKERREGEWREREWKREHMNIEYEIS